MDAYEVNESAVVHAYELISNRRFVIGTDWPESHPTLEQQKAYLKKRSWEDFGRWHLALDTASPEHTIGHYQFAYGDGARVHRSALASCVARAKQGGHRKLEQAAEELLHRLDDKAGIPPHTEEAND